MQGPPQRRELAAWAAGFFEGEGTITLSGGRLTVQLKNTDLEPLDRFWEIIDCGRVYGPYRYQPPRKQFGVWVAADLYALDALKALWPWLSRRRRARATELVRARFELAPRTAPLE